MAKIFVEFGRARKSKSGKTSIWPVQTGVGFSLGEVRWQSRWRTYAFFPDRETVFEQSCLRKIAKFCESKTEDLRKQWRNTRES